jgi:Zn-dependent M16 (insulinase) family peptidase
MCADSMIQATFSAGLKGVKGANVAAAEGLVLQVLQETAESGFTADHIESSMNTIEFNLREFAHGGNPRGLSLFLGAIPAWIYGRDPVDELKFEAPLQNLKAAIAGNPRYFQDLISRFLVNNKHRVTLHMYPDPSFSESREAAEAEQVAKHFQTLDQEGIKQVKEIQQQLQLRQATPDPPEAAASVPSLHVSDLPKDTKVIPKVIKQLGSSSSSASVDTNTNPISHMLLHDQPTNGISYSAVYFDLEALPVHLLPYLPLFTWCLTSCGTTKTSQVDMSHQLGTHTGGIGATTAIYEVPGVPDVAHAYLGIGGKALHNKTDKMASLMHELVLTANLNKKDRILHYLRSTISRHESGLVSGGHRYASSLLAAQYSKPGWIHDVLGGLTQLQAARVLLEELHGPSSNESFDRVVHSLEEIRRLVIQQHNVFLSLTADASTLTTTETSLLQFVNSLPASTPAPPAGTKRKGVNWKWPIKGVSKAHSDKNHLPRWPFPHLFAKDAGVSSLTPTHIGIVVPTQVNYVVKAAPGFDLSPTNKYVPSSAEVLTNILNTGYLWDRVRVQGGAYGGFAGLNRFSGLMSFASYRDPNLGNTLNVYDATSTWLRGLQNNREATQGDIDKSIISTIGGIDAPMSPEERGSTSTARFLTGMWLFASFDLPHNRWC